MSYVLVFLEGIFTFISPCLLPLLPLYISYFAAGSGDRKRTLINALGFVCGFTLVFVALGAFAGSLNALLVRYRRPVEIVLGILIVLFGLNISEVWIIPFLNVTKRLPMRLDGLNAGRSLLFGIVFAVGWSPCVGAFLGMALSLAATSGQAQQGMLMLLLFSLGLGLPFVFSAVLLDRFKSSFDWIKNHYRQINLISGLLMMLMGVLMISGHLWRLLDLFAV